MDTKIALVLDTKIDIREAFQELYFTTFYSLYPDLFTENDGMWLSDNILGDEEVLGRKLFT